MLAEDWLAQPLSEQDRLRELILRYLAAFGPASIRDIQTWSGLTQLQKVVAELEAELRTFRDENGKILFDVIDAPFPSADLPAPPRFLPEFDNLILSHADRTRVMPEEYRKNVFLSAGRVRATFLLDGFVAGTWKVERTREMLTLVIEPFATLSGEQQAELTVEAEALLHFIEPGMQEYNILYALDCNRF
jgi:hypothetical protein